MALWRIGRSWSEDTMRQYLAELKGRRVNFDTPLAEMTAANGWTTDGAQVSLGFESPGPPEDDGYFQRAKQAVLDYQFSDTRIVEGHFDAQAPVVGRDMLLELKVLGFHFLSGVRVHSLREEQRGDVTTFGFRYDTLEGHIERGFEWFLLTKDHQSGELHFKIEAVWRLGDFPSWWSKLGFILVGERFREKWRHQAPLRLKYAARKPEAKPPAAPGDLVHSATTTA